MARDLWAWMQMDELAYRSKSRASYDANGAVWNRVLAPGEIAALSSV